MWRYILAVLTSRIWEKAVKVGDIRIPVNIVPYIAFITIYIWTVHLQGNRVTL